MKLYKKTLMASTILSISVPKLQSDFLDEHPALSPSAIMQSALSDIMERSETFKKELDEQIRKTRVLADELQKKCDEYEAYKEKHP